MSSRIFQSVIIQMKDATDRTVGVVDPDGIIVASTDLSLIGNNVGDVSKKLAGTDEPTVKHDGTTYKSLGQWTANDYMVFTAGDDEISTTVCIMAAIAINEAGIYFEENHDKRTFVKTIVSENILPGDIYVRAKELRFSLDKARGVIVIRQDGIANPSVIDVVQNAFPDKQNDFVFSVGDADIVLVKEMPPSYEPHYLSGLAEMICEKLTTQMNIACIIGVGTVANHLRELAERYKEALISIDIGKIFDTEKSVIRYENLGIGRLIYQLPTTLCEMFLSEIFKKNPIEALDQETLFTIDSFFENSLNVSETARKLYVHRNTLVYRLEKIKKITGLDLCQFDQAIVFKVALMVKKYLVSQELKY